MQKGAILEIYYTTCTQYFLSGDLKPSVIIHYFHIFRALCACIIIMYISFFYEEKVQKITKKGSGNRLRLGKKKIYSIALHLCLVWPRCCTLFSHKYYSMRENIFSLAKTHIFDHFHHFDCFCHYKLADLAFLFEFTVIIFFRPINSMDFIQTCILS